MANDEYPLLLRFIGDESSSCFNINVYNTLRGQHTNIRAKVFHKFPSTKHPNDYPAYKITTEDRYGFWVVSAEYFVPMKPNLKSALRYIRRGTKHG